MRSVVSRISHSVRMARFKTEVKAMCGLSFSVQQLAARLRRLQRGLVRSNRRRASRCTDSRDSKCFGRGEPGSVFRSLRTLLAAHRRRKQAFKYRRQRFLHDASPRASGFGRGRRAPAFLKFVELRRPRAPRRWRAAPPCTGGRKRMLDSWITPSASMLARQDSAYSQAQPVNTAREYRLPPNAVPL